MTSDPGNLRDEVEYLGPFEHHDVVVNGWTVPFLTATPLRGGKVSLTVDRRWALDLDLADAEFIVPWVANAIAVAMGYPCHPNRAMDQRPPRGDIYGPRRVRMITSIETEKPPGV